MFVCQGIINIDTEVLRWYPMLIGLTNKESNMISAERARNIEKGLICNNVVGYKWHMNDFNTAVAMAIISKEDSAFVEGMEYYSNSSKRSEWIFWQLESLGYKLEPDVRMMSYGVKLTWKGE